MSLYQISGTVRSEFEGEITESRPWEPETAAVGKTVEPANTAGIRIEPGRVTKFCSASKLEPGYEQDERLETTFSTVNPHLSIGETSFSTVDPTYRPVNISLPMDDTRFRPATAPENRPFDPIRERPSRGIGRLRSPIT